MARGGNKKFPNKVSFFKRETEYGESYYGPYRTKPTAAFKHDKGEFIEFLLDKDGNYIRQKNKDE